MATPPGAGAAGGCGSDRRRRPRGHEHSRKSRVGPPVKVSWIPDLPIGNARSVPGQGTPIHSEATHTTFLVATGKRPEQGQMRDG